MSINDEVEYFVIRDSPATALTVNEPGPTSVFTVKVPGVQGIPGKVAIGATSTGAPGTDALVTLLEDSTGTSVLSFTVPRGDITDLTIGTIATAPAGSLAAVSVTGTAPNRVLHFTIPTGATGATGAPANLSIGTVAAGVPGSNPVVSLSGSAPNYSLNFTIPRGASGSGTPTGGTTGQVLTKLSNADYDTTWAAIDAGTDAATASTVVKRDANADASFRFVNGTTTPTAVSHLTRKDYVDTAVTAIARRKSGLHTQTAYGITQADEGKVLYYTTDTSAIVYTIPDSTTTITTGTRVEILRPLSGTVTISPAAGVTLYGVDGAGTKTIKTVGGSAFLTKLSGNAWTIVGDVTDSSYTATQAATDAATPSTLVKRDSAGRFKAVDPSAAQDVATKNYIDTALSGTSATGHTHTSSQISDTTTIGRAVMTAATQAAGRTAIGAGTASTKADVGLGNVDNTADTAKPISTLQQSAFDADRSRLTTIESYNKVLVLGDGVAVPGGTPANTVIYRQLTSTGRATRSHWGSGTTFPTLANGLQVGDTFLHTGLKSLMLYSALGWRQADGYAECNSIAERDAIATNYGSALYPGFRVRAPFYTGRMSEFVYFYNTYNAVFEWRPCGGITPMYDLPFNTANAQNWGTDYERCQYGLDVNGRVIFNGLLRVVNAMSANVEYTVATMPVGFRPVNWNGASNGRALLIVAINHTAPLRVDFLTVDGSFRINCNVAVNAGAFVNLDQMSYQAAY